MQRFSPDWPARQKDSRLQTSDAGSMSGVEAPEDLNSALGYSLLQNGLDMPNPMAYLIRLCMVGNALLGPEMLLIINMLRGGR